MTILIVDWYSISDVLGINSHILYKYSDGLFDIAWYWRHLSEFHSIQTRYCCFVINAAGSEWPMNAKELNEYVLSEGSIDDCVTWVVHMKNNLWSPKKQARKSWLPQINVFDVQFALEVSEMVIQFPCLWWFRIYRKKLSVTISIIQSSSAAELSWL